MSIFHKLNLSDIRTGYIYGTHVLDTPLTVTKKIFCQCPCTNVVEYPIVNSDGIKCDSKDHVHTYEMDALFELPIGTKLVRSVIENNKYRNISSLIRVDKAILKDTIPPVPKNYLDNKSNCKCSLYPFNYTMNSILKINDMIRPTNIFSDDPHMDHQDSDLVFYIAPEYYKESKYDDVYISS